MAFPPIAKLYLGWTSRSVRSDLLQTPKAPSHYKDKDAIERHRKAAMAKMQEQAKYVPGVATLARVVLLDADGKVVCDKESPYPYVVAAEFLDFLTTAHHNALKNPPHMLVTPENHLHDKLRQPYPGVSTWLTTLHAQSFLRILAYDLLAADWQPGISMLHLLSNGLPQSEDLVFDIYNRLCPSDMRQYVDEDAWLRWMLPDAPLDPGMDEATLMAARAWCLASKVGLNNH